TLRWPYLLLEFRRGSPWTRSSLLRILPSQIRPAHKGTSPLSVGLRAPERKAPAASTGRCHSFGCARFDVQLRLGSALEEPNRVAVPWTAAASARPNRPNYHPDRRDIF